MSFVTSLMNLIPSYFNISSSKEMPKEPILARDSLDKSLPPDLQTLVYSHLTLDELSEVEKANKDFEHPTNIDRALQVHKAMLLKENPEYKIALEAWEKEKIPLSEQKARIKELRQFAFGKDKWLKHFGEIGEVPPLPADIYQTLNGGCPFEQGKKVKETHMLVLVPKTVTLKEDMSISLSLKSLGELVKAPKVGNKTGYSGLYAGEHAEIPVEKSHWTLMTKTIIFSTRNKAYDSQENWVKAQGPYQVPHAIDAAVSILMTYVNTGERLFGHASYTGYNYTRCQEMVGNNYITIGDFKSAGLCIGNDKAVSYDNGVAPQRKL